MTDQLYPKSQLPIRKTEELLPGVFQSNANKKFMSAVVDPLVQPGLLEKTVGYIGRRYGKTYIGSDIYLDSDNSLRSRYQLEPGVVFNNGGTIDNFYDYIDFKNQLKFFGNTVERDDLITSQEHYSWNPPIVWDKFINYREYYWEPNGPLSVPVNGINANIVSEYDVSVDGNTFVFNANAEIPLSNPTLNLFRGQTYKFNVNAPKEGFIIRNKYDTGSLMYSYMYSYIDGQLAVYDNQLLKAKHTIPSHSVPTNPDTTLDWDVIQFIYQAEISYYNPSTEYTNGEFIVYDDFLWQATENIPANTTTTVTVDKWRNFGIVVNTPTLDYNKGITNNGTSSGTVTFVVPYDSPDELFYQSPIDPNKFGRLIIDDISANTSIDVEKEVIGLKNYTSSNGVVFTNGMVVEFRGLVSPKKYATDAWLVSGVGNSISLVRFSELTTPTISKNVPTVMFDNSGFDTEPFDNAASYPGDQDYITISHASVDSNPWSRYNRWFHRSVLEYSCKMRGVEYAAPEEMRAKRPIIEFTANLQLFNHGTNAKQAVDAVDTVTTDIFSTIEGARAYIVDGFQLSAGTRILVTADKDSLANNKIYKVTFVIDDSTGAPVIHLVETIDSNPVIGECVLVKAGTVFGGAMYHFDGSVWKLSQSKASINQAPLFDVFDENEVSFANVDTYPASNFKGSTILSYKVGNGRTDNHLGFSLSYLNINNIGDIQFNWDFGADTYIFAEDNNKITRKISTGYFRNNFVSNEYANGWIQTDSTYIQPVIDSYVVKEATNEITFTPINFYQAVEDKWVIKFYLNGEPLTTSYTRDQNVFSFNTTFDIGDVVSVKVISNNEPDTGYYEIPVGLEKNPLNAELVTFTLGQADDHVRSAVDFHDRFSGTIPGISNLRDIDNYQQFATRFLKHSGIAPLAISALCDKEENIIKSLRYATKMYTEFKNNFLDKAALMPLLPVSDAVDDIIASLTKTKTVDSPFAYSDMIGSGAYTKLTYTVENTDSITFALSSKFNLTDLSNNAVYVYINRLNQKGSYDKTHLLNTKDYQFNDVYGYVSISYPLQVGDVIEIREYVSTAINYIPTTPSSIGLHKAYTPMIFTDDTYTTPRLVIQGHDGSIMAAYGDYRDALVLELELRIYNNIKQQYDPTIFDIDAILGGYYNTGMYNKQQLDMLIQSEFYKWIAPSNVDHVHNTWYEELNPFTYTYNQALDTTLTQRLPGYWRGIYNWFYDTDRPHRCPWEMLGFSEEPTWWESEYGVAPYTSQNFILWDDLRDGIIRQGDRKGTHPRYSRPDLRDHIPVDANGKLIDPITTGLANNFNSFTDKDNFVFGDVAPVEYSWRSSSDWPFVISIALCLLKPFEYITDRFDISRTKLNKLGQTVHNDTSLFVTLDDIVIPTNNEFSVGLGTYLVDNIKSKGIDPAILEKKIKNLDVRLSTRMSGFVVTDQQHYLLDSKHQSTVGNVFVPPENADIIFNVSSPVKTITYSGVIVEKTNGGWYVSGYDSNNQYFKYYGVNQVNSDPQITLTQVDTSSLMSVGGVSLPYVEWQPNVTYKNGEIVKHQGQFFKALRTNSSATFDNTYHDWQMMKNLPTTGEVTAVKRSSFNKFSVKVMNYGTKLGSIQEVVDFLLGYEEYLKSIGFVFDGYNSTTEMPINWTTSAKELMFWTKHNWAEGSLITLSPIATKIDISMGGGVAESVVDGFYEYEILKANGQPFQLNEVDITRSFQKITISPSLSTDGIYYLNLYCVLKEHVAVFSDRTVFNDVIYDKPTGYRQGRIKSQGYRTVDWDGDYTSPGFLFDNVTISTWAPYTDYKMGDIVSYRSNNWTSSSNQLGTANFDDTKWTKLDSTPSKQLIANFDYKVNQFEDYYDVTSEGIGDNQRSLARHAVGYQTREYLQALAPDPVTQFQLYQGFIREKGTANAINKVFDKLSRSGDSSITMNEEWAFRVGRFGGLDQVKEIEFRVQKGKFKLNPQAIQIANAITIPVNDQKYQIVKDDFTIAPAPYTTNIHPMVASEPVRTAGYVKTDQIKVSVKSRSDILTLDITKMYENDHIWVTFSDYSWDVLRYNQTNLRIVSLTVDGTNYTLTLSDRHGLKVGDIVGIKPINVKTDLVGFFNITAIDWNSITIDGSLLTGTPTLPTTIPLRISVLTTARFSDYTKVDPEKSATYSKGATLWVDNNSHDRWEVVQKQDTYTDYGLREKQYGITVTPYNAGTAVAYSDRLNQTIIGVAGSNYVLVYKGTSLTKHDLIINAPISLGDNLNKSFGKVIALSPDSRFMAVGAPDASLVRNNYAGIYDQTTDYSYGEIVLLQNTTPWEGSVWDGTLWEATKDITVDGSSNSIYSEDWRPATIMPADAVGSNDGYTNQGAVAIYELLESGWSLKRTIISPSPKDNEFFGSDISIGVAADGTYTMAIATALGDGEVYMYEHRGSSWKHYRHPTLANQYNPLLGTGHSVAVSGDCSTILVGKPTTANGEVIPYRLNSNHQYSALATISNQSGNIGDKFGYKVALNKDGSMAIISSPNSDVNIPDQGSVFIIQRSLDGSYTRTASTEQQIRSFDSISNEQFGTSLAISTSGDTLVIGAKNTPYTQYKIFEHGTTTFDENRTRFVTTIGSSGGIYVFEKKADRYFLTAKPTPVDVLMQPYESYGYAVACSDDVVVVGSPNYLDINEVDKIGMVRLFVQDKTVNSWNTIAQQTEVVDITKVKSIELYDDVKNIKIQDLDYVDHAKLKVLNYAEQAITYKTLYDPAVYTNGTDDSIQIIEPSQSWEDSHVGKLWWDVSAVKWVYAEQGDFTYRTGHWNQTATGSSVDVYEWVKTKILPSEWAALADTTEGIAEGISGQPLYPNDDVLTVKNLYNTVTEVATETYYYYWVKNPVIIPKGSTRTVSASDVAAAISNPIGTGVAFVAFTSENELLTFNMGSKLQSDSALINIIYYKDDSALIPVHNEYQLMTEGLASSVPSAPLELKWLDSLIGADSAGNRVPDDSLPLKQRYGLSFRPRQSMFIDRTTVLRSAIEHINGVLLKAPFTSSINFEILNSIDPVPTVYSNRYDTIVDNFIDLQYVNTGHAQQATLELGMTNGKISKVTIVNQGFGYKPSIPVYENMDVKKYNYTGTGYKGPLVTVNGDGSGAVIELIIDNYGRVIMAKPKYSGKKYSNATATVRPFSVLVRSDETVGNFWSIYEWNAFINQFTRTSTQQYDATRYWSYVDWWKDGYGLSSRIIKEIQSIVTINDLETEVGDLIRIKEYENGGWAVFERIANEADTMIVTNYDLAVFSDYYVMVGRQRGTIQLSSNLYTTTFGYDGVSPFDGISYDRDFTRELRFILKAVKEDIFTGEYDVEWNNLFFSSIRAAFAEQMYIDWAFKTSFITATHNIGPFKQTLNYNSDNLSSFESYINEVKPYRTTVREYISKYDSIESAVTDVTDFDLQPAYNYAAGKITPMNSLTTFSGYPWKWWSDNHAYSVTDIVVYTQGIDYDRPPIVKISGSGTGATAQAYISRGKVTNIIVTSPGFGYLSAPTVELVGGNPSDSAKATAVAFIGDSKARMFDLSMKFDRISKTGLTRDFSYTETINNVDGKTSSFRLTFPANEQKSKIQLTKNGQIVLGNAYDVISTVVDDLLVSDLVFDLIPAENDLIVITYEKNDAILDAVDRIEKYYNPTSGMKGKQLSQLITGIDFGGVQVQGATFDVTGGWDAMPWGEDTWDSIESDKAHYHYCKPFDPADKEIPDTTLEITLPYIPFIGQQINVYIKPKTPSRIIKLQPYGLKASPYSTPPEWIRIDDIAYTAQWDSTSVVNPYAVMPTFVGDGVNKVVSIGPHINTFDGDIIVLRISDTDGSVAINDPSIIDTNLQGGSLYSVNGAYSTATGLTAEEIAIDGGVFISKAHVPATEENVPGQVLDSFSIRVFDESDNSSAPIHSRFAYGDAVTKTYEIGLAVVDSSSVLVSVDNTKKKLGTDYTVDIATDTITFNAAPASGKLISIVSVGVGGSNIVAYNTFVADGKSAKYTTSATFKETTSIYVTVNGIAAEAGFTGSGSNKTSGKTVVELTNKPVNGAIVNVVCFKGTNANFNNSIVQLKEQVLTYAGNSTVTVNMFDNVPSTTAPIPAIVQVNNSLLTGIDSTYAVYDGFVNTFRLETKSIPHVPDNIKVYVNNQTIAFINDYTFSTDMGIVTIHKTMNAGDTILITNDVDAQYTILGNQITFNQSKIALVNGDAITVSWFTNYDSMQLVVDETVGGKTRYYLPFRPIAASYLWVYLNGDRMVADKHYSVSGNFMEFAMDTDPTDVVKILIFGANLRREACAFEITKDMFNVNRFTRFSANSVKLAAELRYFDKSIQVTDASSLQKPSIENNAPGMIYINGERIEYFIIAGNTLSQLRRGVDGTSIPETHAVDSFVVNVSINERLPYLETEHRIDVTSNGTLLEIPVDFIPVKSNRTNWNRGNIPTNYGPCDHIEVFVAGRRLHKNPIVVFDSTLSANSPAGDVTIDAEFSVDGVNPVVRLTNPAPVGTRITVFRKVGNLWYDQGNNTASSGITLLDNSTPVAKFIAQKTSLVPD